MSLYGFALFFVVVKWYVTPCLQQCDKIGINYMVDDIYVIQASGKMFSKYSCEMKWRNRVDLWCHCTISMSHSETTAVSQKTIENYICAVFVFLRLPKNQQ